MTTTAIQTRAARAGVTRLVLTVALATLASGVPAVASEAPKHPAATPPPAVVPEPPPPPADYEPAPPPEAGGAYPEPEVTITTKGDAIHEEYRINGRLYKIRVTPSKGKPYWLFDYEGHGQFRRSDLEPDIAIPMWVIKRF